MANHLFPVWTFDSITTRWMHTNMKRDRLAACRYIFLLIELSSSSSQRDGCRLFLIQEFVKLLKYLNRYEEGTELVHVSQHVTNVTRGQKAKREGLVD